MRTPSRPIPLLLALPLLLSLLMTPLVLFAACWAKPALRSANDIARAACHTFAEAREQQLGLSKEDWCKLHDNFDPFLQVILAAERKAGISSGGEAPPTPDESGDDKSPAAEPPPP